MREVGLTFIRRRVDTEELPRESQVVGEGTRARRVGIGGIRAEGIGVPGPHRRIVARAGDLAGRI